jgi:hypothetical protein
LFPMFSGTTAHRTGTSSPGRSVWSSSSAFRWNLWMIEILGAETVFLLKTPRNDREMILEIGKAWLNDIKWSNMVKLSYKTYHGIVICVHLSRIFQMPFFSGSIVVFHWGHVGGRISILKIKRTKLREIASRPGLGVPKFGLRAIPIHIYTYIFNKIAILEGMSKCLHSVIPSFWIYTQVH